MTQLALFDAHRPDEPRAWGPVFYHLSRAGLIVKAGHCQRHKGNGTAGGIRWSLPEQSR